MGLFTRNFDKPGPGVSPDAPAKKGAARFFEIFGPATSSTIWLAGILAMLGGLPFAAGVWFARSRPTLWSRSSSRACWAA